MQQTKLNLSNYGITLNDYKDNYANGIKGFHISNKIKRYNPNITEDQFFEEVASSVFYVANAFISNKALKTLPESFNQWESLVGEQRAHLFKIAIYEEIKYRTLNESFPTLSNKVGIFTGGVIFNGNQKNYDFFNEYLNPLSIQYLQLASFETELTKEDENHFIKFWKKVALQQDKIINIINEFKDAKDKSKTNETLILKLQNEKADLRKLANHFATIYISNINHVGNSRLKFLVHNANPAKLFEIFQENDHMLFASYYNNTWTPLISFYHDGGLRDSALKRYIDQADQRLETKNNSLKTYIDEKLEELRNEITQIKNVVESKGIIIPSVPITNITTPSCSDSIVADFNNKLLNYNTMLQLTQKDPRIKYKTKEQDEFALKSANDVLIRSLKVPANHHWTEEATCQS